MITQKTLRTLIIKHDFSTEDGYLYKRIFHQGSANEFNVKVDFEHKKIYYP